MGKKFDFDYIIIGSGPAGTAAALTLAKTKNRVCIIEAAKFGGSNLNTRDIPYRVGLKYAHLFHDISDDATFGPSSTHFNFPTLVGQQDLAIRRLGTGNAKVYEDHGITCINGYANILDKHTVAVGDHQYTAANFILATGAQLSPAEISGTESINYLTPETAIKLRRMPKAVAVVGGGAAGCEIAEYFAELGVKVIIFEMAERLLPHEDHEVANALTDYFTNNLGMLVLPNSRVVALEQDNISKRIIFSTGGCEKMVRIDTIILATGSKPTLDYGLENAGVKYKRSGITVDKEFRTSAKNIYAIGDVIGGESSTDLATYQGTLLGCNLANKTKNLPDYAGFARVIKTQPEVAVVGLTEDDLVRRDRKYHKAIVYLSDIAAGRVEGYEQGFVKLLSDYKNHLIGAVIVAPRAEAYVNELALAIRQDVSALELMSVPHACNDYSYAIKLAARELSINKK